MSRNLFITGTGTDIGKTYVAGLIVKKLAQCGKNPGYYKAAMSGNERRADGSLIPGDALFVQQTAGIAQPLEEMCPYVYENAYSPHLASRIEGNPVVMDVVKQGFLEVCGKYDYVTVEGSGGILCPICFDEARIRLEDVVQELNLSSIIIADAGLGTINSVVLTVEYMKTKKLPVKGVIFNHFHPGNVMEEDNIFMCEYMTGLPALAKVKDGDTDLDIDIDVLAGLYEPSGIQRNCRTEGIPCAGDSSAGKGEKR
ncbi:MAG: dethiobiotin synthase [Eubacteriales bacterium]|nr:dethiobiotin synthase [Eubacteriales bacterium]